MVPIAVLIHFYVSETIKSKVSILTVREPVLKRVKTSIREIRESSYFVTLLGLMVATFISTFGLTLINPLIPIYAETKVNATITHITLAYTFMGLSGTIFRIYAGTVLDRIERKSPIVLGNVWAAVFTFPMAVAVFAFPMAVAVLSTAYFRVGGPGGKCL